MTVGLVMDCYMCREIVGDETGSKQNKTKTPLNFLVVDILSCRTK